MPRRTHPTHANKSPFVMTGVHDRMLREAIASYHFLTAKQITRLLYPTPKLGNLTTVQAKLKELTDHHYLHSFYLPLPQKQRPYVYCLGRWGRTYLRTIGRETDVYYLPSEQAERSYGWLMHVLELNDFLIAAALIEKDIPSVHLFDMQHDLVLKRRPFAVLNRQGTVFQLVPDALVDFRVGRRGKKDRRVLLWVEYDRGSHSNQTFRAKLRDLLTFVELGYHTTLFGVEYMQVVFPTSAGERRVEKMRLLARLELGTVKETAWRNRMFKFAAVSPLMQPPLAPSTLFCTPLWRSPYGTPDTKVALLPTIQKNMSGEFPIIPANTHKK